MRELVRLQRQDLKTWAAPGLDPGTRELVEAPYIIVYEVHQAREEIEVL